MLQLKVVACPIRCYFRESKDSYSETAEIEDELDAVIPDLVPLLAKDSG
jgi:mannose/fructose/N-acetylgalactosamine-specific phosphotransferase system component IID